VPAAQRRAVDGRPRPIAWHSDGKTYGAEAGDFGKVSHVQLFLGLPKHSDL